MPRAGKRTRKSEPITFETVRELALALPEATEGTSYGTPGFFVRGKLFARLHQSGVALVVRIDPDERALRIRADPNAFFITDHYLNYPFMLVRFANVFVDDLNDLLVDSWRRSAPARVLAAFDGPKSP
jgi:hypothetical protein